MNTVQLNGANPQSVAELIGGTLILHNVSADTALIAGGDVALFDAGAAS